MQMLPRLRNEPAASFIESHTTVYIRVTTLKIVASTHHYLLIDISFVFIRIVPFPRRLLMKTTIFLV